MKPMLLLGLAVAGCQSAAGLEFCEASLDEISGRAAVAVGWTRQLRLGGMTVAISLALGADSLASAS